MAEPTLYALTGPASSVMVEAMPDGSLVWRHWGANLATNRLPPLPESRSRTTFTLDQEPGVPLAALANGTWLGTPTLAAHRAGTLPGWRLLVAGVEQADDRLNFVLDGEGLKLELTLALSGDVLTAASTVTNTAGAPLAIDWLASALLPLPPHASEVLSFAGRHNAELQETREKIPAHAWLRERRGGMTGHGGPPGVFVLAAGADWYNGEVWAAQLAWSGDHRLLVERHGDGWTLQAGTLLGPGEVVLAPGETLRSPELVAAYSREGRNGVLQAFHTHVRGRMTWPGGAMRPRPVHFNSWESVYFAHDEATSMELASAAAALGTERFVLDDGWFAGRNSDDAGLGDWTPDPVRYPNGLRPLAEHVQALGMEFGLWVEPEMVNLDSALARAHPDWILGGPDGPTARQQLVLDLSRPDVREHLLEVLDQVVHSAPIAYLKWDHNRVLAPAIDGSGEATARRQVLGAYALWDALRAAHPNLEIEACAAGGGRIDVGFAARAHRFWTSDNIDAASRSAIQRGFLQFMPPEVMGAHVGASPAHATGRRQTLGFRALVAMPGHFGVELDPRRLTSDERTRLSEWTELYKRHRDRFHSGRTWLGEGEDGLVWQAHGEPGDLLLLASREAPGRLAREAPLRLPLLRGSGVQRVRLLAASPAKVDPSWQTPLAQAMAEPHGAMLEGDWLASVGLPLPSLRGQGAVLFAIGNP